MVWQENRRLSLWQLVWCACLAAVGLAGKVSAAVFEDQFGAATPILGYTNVFGSNLGATPQPGEPSHFGEPASHSVWAKWTATETATYSVATSNSTFDTVLAVYLGSALNNLKVVVTNDDIDFRTLTCQVFFRAYAGETFHFAIDGSGGAQGQVSLQVAPAGPLMTNWSTVDPYGAPFESANLTNSILLVDFWETTCAACVEELPDIVRLHRAYFPRGFTMVGLSIDHNPQDVITFVNVHDEISYPMVMTSLDAKLKLLGGDQGAPTKYLVDQDRRIVARYLGGHDPMSQTYPFYASQLELLLRSPSVVPLQIERTLGVVKVSWPQTSYANRLEASAQPVAGSWSSPGGTVQTNSGRVQVTLPADGDSKFFRLVRP